MAVHSGMPVASRFDYVDHRLDALGVGKGCARLKLAAYAEKLDA
ncbi:hypothetical protein HY36_17645 [Hyphomonas atlantica]|uniref:Uncharacterized protein n=1 Tax=Hyphomonas atlantica TaxID=1280948 RepID=A0A059E008_9PROT|nr:hypothetical protein HY36_17645 [Hyphomonas atlantica]